MALYGAHTDEQLIVSLRKGDADAFTEIYERYWNKLLVYAMRVIRQQHDAEDIVQELFVSIWRRRDVLDIEHALSTYLYNSVRYLAFRYIEKNSTYSDYLQRLGARMAGEEINAPGLEAEIFGRSWKGRSTSSSSSSVRVFHRRSIQRRLKALARFYPLNVIFI
jgi:RNA polymerase sigma factor (sigma-70 family)